MADRVDIVKRLQLLGQRMLEVQRHMSGLQESFRLPRAVDSRSLTMRVACSACLTGSPGCVQGVPGGGRQGRPEEGDAAAGGVRAGDPDAHRAQE